MPNQLKYLLLYLHLLDSGSMQFFHQRWVLASLHALFRNFGSPETKCPVSHYSRMSALHSSVSVRVLSTLNLLSLFFKQPHILIFLQ